MPQGPGGRELPSLAPLNALFGKLQWPPQASVPSAGGRGPRLWSPLTVAAAPLLQPGGAGVPDSGIYCENSVRWQAPSQGSNS